ncbi:MAG TPA: NAD-binding protein, partial [Bacteroidales bacterium]|nr:NAD-binding protein [Bacteroidales bacterium]
MSKKVLVLGLGNFGSELARRLTLEDMEVTGVDINHHLVDLYKDSITNVVEGDATKDEVMNELEVSLYDF